MKRLLTFAAVVFVASLMQVFTAAQQAPSAAPASGDAEKQIATMKQYCVACHNDRTKTAGVSFEAA